MKYLVSFEIVDKVTGIVVTDYNTKVEISSARASEYWATRLCRRRFEKIYKIVSRQWLKRKYSLTDNQLKSMMDDGIIDAEFNLYRVEFRKIEILG